jgi:hypothetical protein
MRSHRFRDVVGVMAATAIVCSGALVAASATATATPTSRSVSAVGTYQARFTPGTPSQLVVSADTAFSKNEGTFSFTGFGDTGSWVISGSTISMIVTTSAHGDTGIVLIGTVAAIGITPGNYGLPGFAYGSWSAKRSTAARRTSPNGSSIIGARRTVRVRPAAKAKGIYAAHFPDFAQSDTLTISNDVPNTREGTFALSTFGDSGNWVVMGKHFAMGVLTGINAGYAFVGTLTSAGINSFATPGRIGVPGAGTFRWYATKA